jgi:hypothetical protein
MTNFLRKINLIQDLNFKLNVSKIDFTTKFRDNVDESNLGYEPFEVFKSSSNEYKGNIYNNNFELKKRRKFFDTSYTFAKAEGILIEENQQLNIKVEINGFKKQMILFFGMMIIFYLIFICGSLFFEDKNPLPVVVLPFILLHMCLMLGLPYFLIKRSVTRMAYDLERDFHYWVTKS